MALSYEGNTSLAFDTSVLREYGNRYGNIATELRDMAGKLDNCLSDLEQSGWTTPAGTAFHEMVNTNWKENIEKYAALLETLNSCLVSAAAEYDTLVSDHIEQTQL